MVDSTRSRHIGNERAARTTELVVEGDAGRERQQPLGDPHPEVVDRAGAVALEREQVLAGPEDRLDALADRGQVETVVGLVGARRAQHTRLHPLDGERELGAGVALVADDRLAAPERARQELERDLPHATGVESSKPTPARLPGLWLAKTPTSHSIVSESRRRRLWKPDWCGSSGKSSESRLRARARKRR